MEGAEKKVLETLAQHLRVGTIPPDPAERQVCRTASALAVAFSTEALLHGEDVYMFLINGDESVPLLDIHPVWCRWAQRFIERVEPNIARGFAGSISLPVNDEIYINIAYRRLVYHRCQHCGTLYKSEVNQRRCELAHLITKRHVRHCLKDNLVIDFWDDMDIAAREKFVDGLRRRYDIDVVHVLLLGSVDIPGSRLMEILEEASESTCLLILTQDMHVCIGKNETVLKCDLAATASMILVHSLAKDRFARMEAEAESVAAELLQQEEAAKQKAARKAAAAKKKKKKKKAKKMDLSANSETTTHFQFSLLDDDDHDPDREKTEDEKLAELEYLIFNTNAFKRPSFCWADDEDF